MLGNKGQFFLIFALVFILYFSTMLNSSMVRGLLVKKRNVMEHHLYREVFENMKIEEKAAFQYSYSGSPSEEVKNFTLYARDKFSTRNMALRLVYLQASYPTVESGVQKSLSTKLLNLKGDEVRKVNLTFSYEGTSATKSSLSHGSSWETSFNFNITQDRDETLTLNYKGVDEKTVTVPLRLGESKKVGFWVLSLKAGDTLIKEDFSLRGN